MTSSDNRIEDISIAELEAHLDELKNNYNDMENKYNALLSTEFKKRTPEDSKNFQFLIERYELRLAEMSKELDKIIKKIDSLDNSNEAHSWLHNFLFGGEDDGK